MGRRVEKTGTIQEVVIDEEKKKAHKTGYITLYNKLFGGKRLSRNCFWRQKFCFFLDLKLYLPSFFFQFLIVGQPRKHQK